MRLLNHFALAGGLALALLSLPAFAAAQTENATEPHPRMFPLMKELVKERPDLPPPYGVAVLSNWIQSDWRFNSANVGIDDASVPVEAAPNCTANIQTKTIGVKGDLWVLPFFNVFVAGGSVVANNQLILRDVPLDFIPPQTVRGDVVVDFDLDGYFYTIGGVIAGGYRKFFFPVDFSATETNFGKKDLVESDQEWNYSVAPRAGYQVGLTQLWVGARYLNTSQRFKGTFPIPSGHNFTFDVDLETVSWNATAGFRTVLQQHWEALLEAGVGRRHMITGSVGYRW